jgi:hypothetical protein
MNWLYEKKMKEGGGSGGGGGGGGAMGRAAAGGDGEPSAFNVIENTNFAKGVSYSGLDVDTSSQGNGGESIPGAFAFLRGAANPGDRAGQEYPGGGQPRGGGGGAASQRRSKKEEMFDKQMEAYQRERERGMPPKGQPMYR